MLCCGAWRTGYAADIVCLVVQVGDGSTTDRYTPVAVVGLSSGVAMVALGMVRLFLCMFMSMYHAYCSGPPLNALIIYLLC